jgi:viologen exporter family transport system permease protein
MRRYADLYPYFLRQHFKALLEYRVGFIIGLTGMCLTHAATLAFIWVIMSQLPTLNGWRLPELLLIYGLLCFSRSFAHMFTDNTWVMGGAIQYGFFDRFLVRPIDPLFHLLADGFNIDGVGNFLVGGVLLITAGQALGIFSSLINLAYLVVTVASGAVIFFALNLISSVSAFWITDSIPVSELVFGNFVFAQYPLSIYPRVIRFLLTWVVPYGFTSFYPASFLLGRDVGPLVWLSPLVAVVLVVIGYRFWLVGLRRYEGTGS